MIYVIYGAVGMLAVLGLLFLGAFCGWKACEVNRNKVITSEVNAEAQRRFVEEQQAFESMFHYNQDTAYGLNRGVADLGGES